MSGEIGGMGGIGGATTAGNAATDGRVGMGTSAAIVPSSRVSISASAIKALAAENNSAKSGIASPASLTGGLWNSASIADNGHRNISLSSGPMGVGSGVTININSSAQSTSSPGSSPLDDPLMLTLLLALMSHTNSVSGAAHATDDSSRLATDGVHPPKY